jgi:methionine-S-sulfoxide reductase
MRQNVFRIAVFSLSITSLLLLGSRCSDEETSMTYQSDSGSESRAENGRTETAIFAAGCFWGVEDAFQNMPGVIDVVSGYTGGRVENPTYRQVCRDDTGHAEAVKVTYDPRKVSYEDLVEKFWEIHNPTQVNRQGPDFGSQYRSAIFYLNDTQKQVAQRSKQQLEESGTHSRPIATEITEAGTFYPAEEYHQDYIAKKGGQACH